MAFRQIATRRQCNGTVGGHEGKQCNRHNGIGLHVLLPYNSVHEAVQD